MEKQLENPGKKKKPKHPSSAQSGRAPAPPHRWAAPVSGSFFPRALTLSLSLSLPSGARLSRRFPSPARPSSLSASRARFARRRVVAPRTLALSLSVSWAPPVSSAFPVPRRGPAPAHSHTSPESSTMSPAHAPSSFLSTGRARTQSPVPFCTTSLSLALCPCRSTSPETHARRTGLLARWRPRQANPSSAPRRDICSCAWFSLFVPTCSQFGLAGVRPRLLAVPTRCPANPTPSSASVLVHSASPPSLNLDRALSRSIASPSGWDSSPELSRPARSLFPAVLPSLTPVSWPQPRQRVC
jgi:hypothetical protein